MIIIIIVMLDGRKEGYLHTCTTRDWLSWLYGTTGCSTASCWQRKHLLRCERGVIPRLRFLNGSIFEYVEASAWAPLHLTWAEVQMHTFVNAKKDRHCVNNGAEGYNWMSTWHQRSWFPMPNGFGAPNGDQIKSKINDCPSILYSPP